MTDMSPEDVVTLTHALVDNAKRLGLTWSLSVATVVNGLDPTNVFVLMDSPDDTKAIPAVSMVGSLGTGQRAYVMSIPPAGVYIVGRVGRSQSDWTTYKPVWLSTGTQPTVGNGTLNGRYIELPGRVGQAKVSLVFGSTSGLGTGNYGFTLPPGWASGAPFSVNIGSVVMRDQSSAVHSMGGIVANLGQTTIDVIRFQGLNVVTNTAPFPWGSGDFIYIDVSMELAPR